MSNALAIATVTAALGRVVHRAALSAVPGADLATGRPEDSTGVSAHRVHLYLYQVTPNGTLRNADLPTRSSDGAVVARPTAALDLSYVIAFYGDAGTLEPERMLGAVVRDLHRHSVLTRDDLRAGIGSGDLAASDLAEAVELVKLTPTPLTLEELSRLWSVFFQTRHAVSVTYQASVVTIESDVPSRPVLPVLLRGAGDRGVTTVVGPFPALERVEAGLAGDELLVPKPPAFPSAQLGLTLFIRGRNLAEAQAVRFVHPRLTAPLSIAIPPAAASGHTLQVALPNNAAAQNAWAAGIMAMSVDLPPVDGLERQTNALPLALAPIIQAIGPTPLARDADGNVPVQVTCRPKVRWTQRAALLVDGHEVPAAPRDDDSPPTATLNFLILGPRAAANAVVQLRVDGVDSMPLARAGSPPVFGFDPAQQVTVP